MQEDGCYKKLMEEMSGKPILGEVEFKLPQAEGAFRPKSGAVGEEWPRSAQTAVSQRRNTA